MTNLTGDDAIECALNRDVLRKAADSGELATRTLLVLAEDLPAGELVAMAKECLVRNESVEADAENMRRIRQITAQALSASAQDAPSKRIRKAARRYLKDGTRDTGIAAYEIGVRSFAEYEAEDAENGWGQRAMLANIAAGECALCRTPFGRLKPEELVLMRKPGQERARSAALCAACAMLSEKDKTRRIVEVVKRLPELRKDEDVKPSPVPFTRTEKPLVDDLLDAAEAFAREKLIGVSNGELGPTWLLQHGGTLMACPTPWGSDDEKTAVRLAMRQMMHDIDVEAYAFVSETWATPPGTPPGVRPCRSPDRQETVTAVASDGTAKKIRSWRTVRGGDGLVTDLAYHDEMDAVKSRLANMLDPPKTGTYDIEAARQSTQTEFTSSDALDDSDGRVFVTDVADAPFQINGRLGCD
jgi:hypothetical protein